MADLKKLEGMIDSTPIMKDYADIESSKLPEFQIDSKIPEGPVAEKWTNYKAHQKLVNPANKRHLDIIVVGTGLAGASAASTLGELGFNVLNFCIQDSPRRAHSIAAQGGINAAKDYQNDGDSVYRLFYDTVKGGDFRSREANVYRLAEVSNNIIDQCVAQGVPFAREYGGLLANRSFGGAQVSRTFYAKGQTGQQLLLGAYASLNRQIKKGTVKSYNRREMLDIVMIDGRARGVIMRNLITGELERYAAHAVVLATGGYGRRAAFGYGSVLRIYKDQVDILVHTAAHDEQRSGHGAQRAAISRPDDIRAAGLVVGLFHPLCPRAGRDGGGRIRHRAHAAQWPEEPQKCARVIILLRADTFVWSKKRIFVRLLCAKLPPYCVLSASSH